MRLFLFIFLTLQVATTPAVAQSNPPQNAQTTTTAGEANAEVDALIRILENDKARARLIDRLREADPQATEPSALVASERAVAEQVAAYARGAVRSTVDLVHAVASLGRHAVAIVTGRATVDTHRIWFAVRDVGLVVFVTFAAYFFLRVAFRRLQQALAARGRDNPAVVSRIGIIALCSGADVMTVLLAWAAGHSVAMYLDWSGQVGAERAHFLAAFLFIELTKVVARVLLAPKWPSLRFTPLGDLPAAYWYFWLSRLVSIVGYTFFFLAPVLAFGVSQGAAEALRVLVLSLAFAMACVIILQNRDAVRAGLIRHAEKSESEPFIGVLAHLARLWHIAAIGYLLLIFVLWLIEHEAALPFVLVSTAESLIAITLGLLLSMAIGRIAARGMQLPADLKARLPLLERRLNAFVPNVLRAIRVVITLTVVLAVAQIWHVADLAGWLSSELGQRVAAAIISAAFILLVGGLIYLAVQSWVEYRLNPDFGRVPSPRERTLLALFRNAFTIALSVIIGMLVLSELGVNIGPLLAGAGIIGLAVGFGAQKLVQDIINGAFIQFENALNEGDVVMLGGVTGVVERLTIRSVSLRTLDGAYHLIPFSSVDSVANFTRNFSYHVAMIRVDYKEKIPEVKKAMQEAFERLKLTEAGKEVIGDLEMHGVTEFSDSSVIVRARIMTAPGQQWALGRAYNEIVKEVFDERGIEIPFPRYAIHFSQGKKAHLPPLQGGGSSSAPTVKNRDVKDRAVPARKRRRKSEVTQDGPAE